MNTIYFDRNMPDQLRRQELYNGQLFAYSRCDAVLRFAQFTRDLIIEAFGDPDPATIQERVPVERCVEILAELKPRFIHHPESKRFVREMLVELGCDPDKTYFDVPRMRTAFPADYLSSGIAYAFHPHRDTWYSAPMCQINWWLPIFEITSGNSMALHPQYWNRAVKNGSSGYNYYLWNKESRKNAAQHIKSDTRVQPKAEEPLELDPQVRLVPDVGGVIAFSAAQMHSTVPNATNATRYSIDFRTVHVDDVWARNGAPNVDSACTGTTMRDYLRVSDLTRVPEEAVAMYDDGTAILGDVIFRGTAAVANGNLP